MATIILTATFNGNLRDCPQKAEFSTYHKYKWHYIYHFGSKMWSRPAIGQYDGTIFINDAPIIYGHISDDITMIHIKCTDGDLVFYPSLNIWKVRSQL
jgi:hypothetical protein